MNSLLDEIMKDAERRGEFDNLSGAGKPLPAQGNPADAVLNRLMTEAKVKPPVVRLKEEIIEARCRLTELKDTQERNAQMKVLSDLELRLALEVEALRKYG